MSLVVVIKLLRNAIAYIYNLSGFIE